MPRNLGPNSGLVDLGVVCLICLRAEPGYCSIYGQDLETPHMQIVDKIRSCSALQLERSLLSQLPDKICHGCRNELSITYRFQQKCLEAQKVFQSAASATLLVDVDKLELEQTQHLKLPSSLRVKRLGAEPTANKIKYYPDEDDHNVDEIDDVDDVDDVDEADDVETLSMIQPDNGASALVLQDVTTIASDTEDDKMIALDVDWAAEQTEQLQQQRHSESEQDNDMELEQEFDHEQELEPEQEQEQEQDEDDDYKLPDEEHLHTQTTSCAPVNNNNSSNSNNYNNYNNYSNHNNGSGNGDNIIINIGGVVRNRRTTESKICDICGNTYKYQHALNAHMRRHNNERPYPCEVCQKAFISNVELRRHMRVHTGQKPYGCHYCDRRFSDFGSSKKHERIHTGERPYICEVCNKGFAYAHVLSVHRRIHTGKKQFQCTQCDKGFTKKSYLATHLAQHQPEVEVATATLQRLPTRKRQQQQKQQQQQQQLQQQQQQQQQQLQQKQQEEQQLRRQQQQQQQQHLRYNSDLAVGDDDSYDDDNVSVGIGMTNLNQAGGEQAKVLEECIVTNDFMFNDDDADDTEQNLDDYHDTELDDSEFQSVQHVKVPYGLVSDLLDADELVSDTKYLME
ncbi:zinc finger protein squeeze [Drosophila hydei]|uniref:Zinc finger protein squeeze n=1 Tax=Drosophila hydei TaxID=7224 RepID=A0A6J1M614_DROHY|nr:zinc finger protein squeeze [Drosophila hydei]